MDTFASIDGCPANWIGNTSFKAPTLGLIIAPRSNDGYGWSRPLVTAFVSRGEDSYPEVEFANVKVEGKADASAFTFLVGWHRPAR